MERAGESGTRRLAPRVPAAAGIVLAVVGVVLLVTGWWGISGESVVALQLPYLASCTIPGAALLIAGAVLISGHRPRATDERVEVLYGLLTEPITKPITEPITEPATGPASTGPAPSGLVAVEGGTRSHRRECALMAGKATVPVTDPAVLTPCPVCQPGP